MGFSFRPSFTVELASPSSEVLAHVVRSLEASRFPMRRTRPPGGGPDVATKSTDHLVLTVPPAERHFWSPWLTIEIEATARAGARVQAVFSPHPSVWTGYLFGYLGLAVVLLFSLLYAAATAISSSGSAWSLWIAGGTVVVAIAMWYASLVGQRLAAAQMDELRVTIDRALADLT